MIQLHGIQKTVGPFQLFQIHQAGGRSIGIFCHKGAGQPQDNVVLGIEHFVGSGIDIRFMFLDPHQLLSAVGRGDLVSGQMIELIFVNSLPDFCFLLRGSHICPDDSVAQGGACFINTDTAHHLAAEGYGGDISRIHMGNQLLGTFHHGVPPVVGILLCPVTVGIIDRIMLCNTGYQRTFL